MITRRSLIRSMGAILAAPAIVRVGSLMPVRSLADDVVAAFAADEASRLARAKVIAEMADRLLLPGLEWIIKTEVIPGQWATVFNRPSLPIA